MKIFCDSCGKRFETEDTDWRAFINEAKKADALWLIVERGLDSPDVEKIMGMFRDEDESENVAYPILVDEVEKIRDACDEWLERESQNNMKENI